ncbi:hypothetical protein DF185_08325 [Marinifilum breve]|uniref:Lipoprotein n=1 Tax=Marinifilum breve TaxID=2184082 RepID=A0A2V4A2C2_9BACT|nr:hypothetical protein [Marinifilum breve]PXY01480.1 hypothetical protein DF185_08325 [Marinifilum breve]
MKAIKILLILLSFSFLTSCELTEEEKLQKILTCENLFIQQNIYGGIVGYGERKFHLKEGKHETLLIIEPGTDYQTFIRMEGKKKLLKLFIKEAFKTNNPGKKMSNSCLTGVDFEYIFKSGNTTLTLRPDERTNSIFNQIIYEGK